MKRYITSSIVTFLSVFFVAILAQWDNLDLNAFTNGAWVSIVFVAIRAGIKALIEYFLATFSMPVAKKSKKIKI